MNPPNPEELTEAENAIELALQEADTERANNDDYFPDPNCSCSDCMGYFDDFPSCDCGDDPCTCGGFSGYPY